MAVDLGRAPGAVALRAYALKWDRPRPRGAPELGLTAERRAAFHLQLVNIYYGCVLAAAGVKELPTPH